MSEQNEMDNPVLDALALAVEPVEPPAALRERILSAASGAAAAREDAEVVPLTRVAPRRAFPRIPLGAVAAMVAVALLAGLVAGDVIGRSGAPQPAPSSTRFTLSGHGPMSAASATVVDLRSDSIAIVTFTGLPELPASKVYEVWLITASGRADSAGVFVPDANGGKVVVVNHALAGYQLMAVTVEAGPSGVTSPTQQPQIYGTVT